MPNAALPVLPVAPSARTATSPRPATRPARKSRGATAAARAKAAKACTAAECLVLEQIPNIGPSLANDLRQLGVTTPTQLAAHDAFALYGQLCQHTGQRQDPCVLDSFMAAVDFMRGAARTPWWHYTAQRKALHGAWPWAAVPGLEAARLADDGLAQSGPDDRAPTAGDHAW